MQLEVTENIESEIYELTFSSKPPQDLRGVLKTLKFKKTKFSDVKYTVDRIPAYESFVKSLEGTLNSGKGWQEVIRYPVFDASVDSINKGLFTIASIGYSSDGKINYEDYIIFEIYKPTISTLVKEYGKFVYGDQYEDREISSKKLVGLAKNLVIRDNVIDRDGFESIKIIVDETSSKENTTNSETESENETPEKISEITKVEQQTEKTREIEIESKELTHEKVEDTVDVTDKNEAETKEVKTEGTETKNTEKESDTNTTKSNNSNNFLQNELKKNITDLENDERRTYVGLIIIYRNILKDLEPIILFSTDELQKIAIKKITNEYKKWLVDLKTFDRDVLLSIINRLLLLLDDTTKEIEIEKGALSIKQTIWNTDKVIQNVLVPIHAEEPFGSGDIKKRNKNLIRIDFRNLFKIQKQNLHEVSLLDLFYLTQLVADSFVDIKVSQEAIETKWRKDGEKLFKQLGFPTNLKYPYVNLNDGYYNIKPLETVIFFEGSSEYNWYKAITDTRPIRNLDNALIVIEQTIQHFDSGLKKYINDSTGKVKDDKESKKQYTKITSHIQKLTNSKLVIKDYLNDKKLREWQDSQASNVVLTSDETVGSIKLRNILQDVISGLITIEDDLTGEQETIIATTIHDLEDTEDQYDEKKFLEQLEAAIVSFKDWANDLEPKIRDKSVKLINQLITELGGQRIALKSEKSSLVTVKDIKRYGKLVENVLVPIHAKEPFQSGSVHIDFAEELKEHYPDLFKLKTDELHSISSIELFQLSQLPHPKDYGIPVNRGDVLSEWENRGTEGFDEIGFPTDLDYPYVNIHVGYKSVSTLGFIIGVEDNRNKWWSVVEHARPIANLSKGIVIIDKLVTDLLTQQQKHVNPKTKRPKTKKEHKEAYTNISYEITRLKLSKQKILNYLEKQAKQGEIPAESPTNNSQSTKEDYIDRVVATMHLAYREGKRLSKKKIEVLQEETGTPSMGELWEAVELSWLLWYKTIYNESISFEARLTKMIHFWNKIQPTYAYSDSSKELYKQYSTPCPIGAIIAQYTLMDQASNIFEPSAGNGLLLTGANPKVTDVNEIDTSRKKSLDFQQFRKITNNNAAEAFPKEMEKKYDVVVTNPPFASWEEDKFDKDHIVRTYFNNSRGLKHHLRLEHVMAGLALRTLKDTGRAAIIIMGHVYFDDDGYIARYRPFFNWLYRYYKVDDIINMNSFKLYNKQGAVAKTMLILIGGRKEKASGVAPTQKQQPHLDKLIESFEDLWEEVKLHTPADIQTIIKQLKIAKRQ